MPRISHFLTWSPALLLVLACSTEASPVDQEGALRAALAQYDSAWDTKDTARLTEILASDYLYFSSKGDISTKATTVAFVADTSYLLTRSYRSEVAILIDGTVGRMSSRWEGNGRYQGQPVNDDQTCGLTWILRGGKWLLFAEHCTDRRPR